MSKILKNNVSFHDYEERFGKKFPYKYREHIHFDLPKLLKNTALITFKINNTRSYQ